MLNADYWCRADGCKRAAWWAHGWRSGLCLICADEREARESVRIIRIDGLAESLSNNEQPADGGTQTESARG